jgi:hypothetical protein
MNNKTISIILSIPLLILQTGCKKLVTIDAPISSVTTAEVFSSDVQATSAMAGVYTTMLNGTSNQSNSIYTGFAAGLSTLVGGYSSDELVNYGGLTTYATNHLTALTTFYSNTLWNSAYKAIYNSNAIIEGIAASTASNLHDSVRVELTAEAKFVRAFSYLYLVSFFGDVPLALTVDFNKTQGLPRSPQQDVYKQIVQDLKDAQAALPEDYTYGNGERIVPNKWAATALLARVYLYTGDNTNAAAQASAVIGNTAQYSLVADPNNVFLRNSTEAIWQLQQYTLFPALGTATPEGVQFIPTPLPHNGSLPQYMTTLLANSFEPGDRRRLAWIDSTDNSVYAPSDGIYYYPVKYKIASYNRVQGGTPPEYYMVLRLAEQYLIRAEAEMNGADGGSAAAIADLNIIRNRAGLPPLSGTLTPEQLLAALAHERQEELFCEWGHRWFDLRRLGVAHDVLSAIDYKQPWAGDYQFLYPIPINEITDDHFLTQNKGY